MLTEGMLKRLEAFDRQVTNVVKLRKVEYFGHVLSHPENYLIIKGKILGK